MWQERISESTAAATAGPAVGSTAAEQDQKLSADGVVVMTAGRPVGTIFGKVLAGVISVAPFLNILMKEGCECGRGREERGSEEEGEEEERGKGLVRRSEGSEEEEDKEEAVRRRIKRQQ